MKSAATVVVSSVLVVVSSAGVNAQQETAKPRDQRNTSAVASAEAAGPRQNGRGHPILQGTMVDLDWPSVKKAAEEKQLVLLPLGVIEEHGPHMSLGADTYLASLRCQLLKKALSRRQVAAVVAPPVYWGVMALNETGAYPGSFTVSPETMKALLGDIFARLHAWGFDSVYVVNHHGDRAHRGALAAAIADARQRLGLRFYNDQERADGGEAPRVSPYTSQRPFAPDFHAGATETAEMLAYFPEEVDVSRAAVLQPQSGFHPLGYVGDPARHQDVKPRLFEEVFLDFYADRIAKWYREPRRPTPPPSS